MQLKPITAIAVLLLVVASLSVAGCTIIPTSSTTTHDAFLEQYLATYKNVSYSDFSRYITAWDLAWINSTSARLQYTYFNNSDNATWNYDERIIVFPTSQAATQYLDAMNNTAYRLCSTEYAGGGAYQEITGHAPQIYKDYTYNEGNPLNISEYRLHEIEQLDNIVFATTGKKSYNGLTFVVQLASKNEY